MVPLSTSIASFLPKNLGDQRGDPSAWWMHGACELLCHDGQRHRQGRGQPHVAAKTEQREHVVNHHTDQASYGITLMGEVVPQKVSCPTPLLHFWILPPGPIQGM